MLLQALLKHSKQLIFPLLPNPATVDRILDDGLPFFLCKVEGLLHSTVVLEDVPAKVRRIVAVDAELDAIIEELPQGDLANLLHCLQANIAQWADSQHDLLLGRCVPAARDLR